MPDARNLIHCPSCGNTLGASVASFVVIRHKGREWIGRAFSIRCESCGGTWESPELDQSRLLLSSLRDRVAAAHPDLADELDELLGDALVPAGG